jgi:hypothetical protein
MKWLVFPLLVLGGAVSARAKDVNIRVFRPVDPAKLEQHVPAGYGKVFLEAGREYHIDPLFLAAISAHETGRWKSKAARKRNNWMGLISRGSAKRFSKPADSIFYAARLLNRRPFKNRNTLGTIAPVYCTEGTANWKRSILQWERLLAG